MYREDRFKKLVKAIEKKLIKIEVTTDNFDDLSEYQEAELDKFEYKIKKVFDVIWNETNYDSAVREWDLEVEKSELSHVIEHLR